MSSAWKQTYGAALNDFLNRRDEASRQEAYTLGRAAIDHGLGILELSEAHQSLLREILASRPGAGQLQDTLSAAEFFAESIAPYEMQLRGYREANLALKDANSQLEQRVAERTRELELRAVDLARSNEELERFASLASHDLQEPLRLIGIYASNLEQKRDSLEESLRESVERIQVGVNRMRGRINALLSYAAISRKAPALPEPVPAGAALKTALSRLEPQLLECNAKVNWSELPIVLSETNLVVSVFENLVDNALKFRGKRPPLIKVSATQQGAEVVFSVTDSGIGIDRGYWKKIFVIFQRLHHEGEYPGTGTGLAICKRLVERQGGRIWIEHSQPGSGTTVCFTLPSLNPV